jgi:head-tail adaptor
MDNKNKFAGQFNKRVELFANDLAISTTSERIRTPQTKGKRWAMRMEAGGSEAVADGQVIIQDRANFVLRFEKDLMVNGHAYFIRDLDGDFYVKSVEMTGGRNRYLILKCLKNE